MTGESLGSGLEEAERVRPCLMSLCYPCPVLANLLSKPAVQRKGAEGLRQSPRPSPRHRQEPYAFLVHALVGYLDEPGTPRAVPPGKGGNWITQAWGEQGGEEGEA